MKKRRLKKWVKIVLIIMIILLDLVIYQKSGKFGALAQSSTIYLVLCVSCWIWLLLGQFGVIWFIVEVC